MAFDALPVADTAGLTNWMNWLRQFNVFFCTPLDLDYSMLKAFPLAYQVIEPGRQGPSPLGEPRTAVLGEDGQAHLYAADQDTLMRLVSLSVPGARQAAHPRAGVERARLGRACRPRP